jgi:hypothetical protein
MAENQPNVTTADPELVKRLGSLYRYMAPRLGIKQIPQIIFTQDKNNSDKPFGHTAYYDHSKRLIRVYITDRHPTDILRSFAHELIHHWQNENGAMPKGNHDPTHYAQKNPTLRLREQEAYLLGNMIFRDWQDENRYGKLHEGVQSKHQIKIAIKRAIFEVMKQRTIRPLQLEDGKTTISELKRVIRKRLEEVGKRHPERKHELYSKWLDKYLQSPEYNKYMEKSEAEKAEGLKWMNIYHDIGFSHPDDAHFCWYWDEQKHKIVAAQGGSHSQFDSKDPYYTFRGRFDLQTKKLSLTIPLYGHMSVTKDIKKDVPSEIITALKKAFKPKEIVYVPDKV